MVPIRLSELINEIDETLQERFAGETFWITAEITDVKKQTDKRWCFLKFIEREGRLMTTEIRAVFWSGSFHNIEKFESLTGQPFSNGLEIICQVRVRFHPRYGLDLEVLEIDLTYAVGKSELERQQTLERLVRENPTVIRLVDGHYVTFNKKLELPIVLQRIALVTAPGSDGQRDFKNEIVHNSKGYAFAIFEFLTQLQGDQASQLICTQLKLIRERHQEFDVVVIVRGGGSETDFKPFDDYELARCVAAFPIPVLTGIGHDRNTSIVDRMVRQHKTPTKVASTIVDHNFNFEQEILDIKERLLVKTGNKINQARSSLQHLRRTITAYSPATILRKGYAMIMLDDKIIVNPNDLAPDAHIKTILKDEIIHSTITQKTKNATDF